MRQLAELIVSQGDEQILESHRREIVVVFCDLRGYTAFTETAEPEEVLDFLREYHGALGPLVSQFEGTLDQFAGDGIMVFFNDPVPIPDPAARAVSMAVAMRAAAASLIADNAIGTVCNVAARLCAEAKGRVQRQSGAGILLVMRVTGEFRIASSLRSAQCRSFSALATAFPVIASQAKQSRFAARRLPLGGVGRLACSHRVGRARRQQRRTL